MAKGPPVVDLRLYFSAADGDAFKAESVMGTKRFPEREGIQMRRALSVLAAAAFTVLAFAGTASANTQVIHFKYSGTAANVMWSTYTDTSNSFTTLNVSENSYGRQLYLEQFIVHLDPGGVVTGVTQTFGSAWNGTGYTFEQSPGLISASVSGSVLATSTFYPADPTEPSITTERTIPVNVTWTGQSTIYHGVNNMVYTGPGFREIDHSNGIWRSAQASGTAGDLTYSASETEGAAVGRSMSGTTSIYLDPNGVSQR